MQRVVLRADGNSKIGLGHVYRSLALAEMLKDEFKLIFVIKEPVEPLVKVILETCDKCVKLVSDNKNKQKELLKIADLLEHDDIIVLDGYHFDGYYQKTIKGVSHTVISIDDMHQGFFHSDYVLNHCGGLNPTIYDRAEYTQLLLGEQYALLRPSFLEAAQNKIKQQNGKPYTLFVCMGGSDYQNITYKILKAVEDLSEIGTINIVLGVANKHTTEIHRLAESDNRCNIYCNLSGKAMCELMKSSDVAIAPGSSISLEICAVGMGFISGYYTDNQLDIVNWLDKSGSASIMGDFRELKIYNIKEYIEFFLNEIDISALIENQKTVDGHSKDRLRKFFSEL